MTTTALIKCTRSWSSLIELALVADHKLFERSLPTQVERCQKDWHRMALDAVKDVYPLFEITTRWRSSHKCRSIAYTLLECKFFLIRR